MNGWVLLFGLSSLNAAIWAAAYVVAGDETEAALRGIASTGLAALAWWEWKA